MLYFERRESSACLIMLSAKQSSHCFHLNGLIYDAALDLSYDTLTITQRASTIWEKYP